MINKSIDTMEQPFQQLKRENSTLKKRTAIGFHRKGTRASTAALLMQKAVGK